MLPNLIIIGAMKCGTSSLHYYLSQHPDICMSERKELDFFLGREHWHKGLAWYESHFQGDAKVYGEASPNYTKRHVTPGVPERIHTVIPHTKLIYIFRDPVDRCVSQYVHGRAKSRIHAALSEIFADLDNPKARGIIETSRYYAQLEPYLERFSRSQLLTVAHEELLLRRRETLRQVFRFLHVDEKFDSPHFDQVRHRSENKKELNRLGKILSVFPGVRTIQHMPQTIRRGVEHFMYSRIERPVVTTELRERLAAVFQEDWRKMLQLHEQQVLVRAA